MLGKIGTFTLIITLAATAVFAQRRDFRKEREELAREEREEKRKLREERYSNRPVIDYGTNIIRFSPITALDIGVGFGLSYEKIFGEERMIGLVLPIYLMLEDRNDYNYDPFGNNTSERYHPYFYFTPGLKIYPFGQRKVTYAVGPSAMIGFGGGSEWRYDYNTGSNEWVDVQKLRIGLLVNNYVNFQFTKSFNLGLEGGIGVRYIDRESYDRPVYGRTTYSNGINITGQFSLTLGYRF